MVDMDTLLGLILVFLCFAINLHEVTAHGRMLNPPGRSSMWRYGYNVPVNYNDNQLFCGGYRNSVIHGGKCGACGDPFQGPYENEAGGKYAKGIIVRHFPRGGVHMPTTIDMTAFHKGYVEFRLCPHDRPDIRVKQECLDKYLLEIEEGADQGNPTRFYPEGPGIHHLKVKLPADVVCYQCVLQWKYTTGNFWGTDPDGRSCMGCGHQELFVNCADIAIGVGITREEKHERVDIIGNNDQFNQHLTSIPDAVPTAQPKHRITTKSSVDLWTKPDIEIPVSKTFGNQSDECNKCHALPTWKHFPRMDEWCDTNCKNGNCPSCRCYCGCPDVKFQNPCKGQGDFALDTKMESWCWRECCEAECPADKCACSVDIKNPLSLPFRDTDIKTNAKIQIGTDPIKVPNPNFGKSGVKFTDVRKSTTEVPIKVPTPNLGKWNVVLTHVRNSLTTTQSPTKVPNPTLDRPHSGMTHTTNSMPSTKNPKLSEEKRRVLNAFLGNRPPIKVLNKFGDSLRQSRNYNTNSNIHDLRSGNRFPYPTDVIKVNHPDVIKVTHPDFRVTHPGVTKVNHHDVIKVTHPDFRVTHPDVTKMTPHKVTNIWGDPIYPTLSKPGHIYHPNVELRSRLNPFQSSFRVVSSFVNMMKKMYPRNTINKRW